MRPRRSSRSTGKRRTLSSRMRLVEQQIAEIRDSIERLKGEKRGREELLKKLTSIGEQEKERTAPFKRLIDVLRTPEGAENALEKFFADEMEYRVLTVSDPQALADAVRQYGGNFIFFPDTRPLQGARAAKWRLHSAGWKALRRHSGRIQNGEEGTIHSRGRVHRFARPYHHRKGKEEASRSGSFGKR